MDSFTSSSLPSPPLSLVSSFHCTSCLFLHFQFLYPNFQYLLHPVFTGIVITTKPGSALYTVYTTGNSCTVCEGQQSHICPQFGTLLMIPPIFICVFKVFLRLKRHYSTNKCRICYTIWDSNDNHVLSTIK